MIPSLFLSVFLTKVQNRVEIVLERDVTISVRSVPGKGGLAGSACYNAFQSTSFHPCGRRREVSRWGLALLFFAAALKGFPDPQDRIQPPNKGVRSEFDGFSFQIKDIERCHMEINAAIK